MKVTNRRIFLYTSQVLVVGGRGSKTKTPPGFSDRNLNEFANVCIYVWLWNHTSYIIEDEPK